MELLRIAWKAPYKNPTSIFRNDSIKKFFRKLELLIN